MCVVEDCKEKGVIYCEKRGCLNVVCKKHTDFTSSDKRVLFLCPDCAKKETENE